MMLLRMDNVFGTLLNTILIQSYKHNNAYILCLNKRLFTVTKCDQQRILYESLLNKLEKERNIICTSLTVI